MPRSLGKDKKAVSPAISMTIITAVTVILVLVASIFAYQTLERQRGNSEFETVQKSIVAFDDAVRDVAWDLDGSRSSSFTVDCGQLRLVQGGNLTVKASVDGVPFIDVTVSTISIRYSISTNYVTFGDKYKTYIFGDESHVVTSSVESYGRALVEQKQSSVDITLSYRVRVMRTRIELVGNKTVNYVDILIIKTSAPQLSTYIGNFDLIARNVGITASSNQTTCTSGTCTVSASIGGSTSSRDLDLEPGTVVFNFVVAEVQVTV